MRGKRQLPEWIPGTMREFRQRKRKELKELIKAFNKVWRGCAYAPCGPFMSVDGSAIYQLRRGLKEIKKVWSQKEWGK